MLKISDFKVGEIVRFTPKRIRDHGSAMDWFITASGKQEVMGFYDNIYVRTKYLDGKYAGQTLNSEARDIIKTKKPTILIVE